MTADFWHAVCALDDDRHQSTVTLPDTDLAHLRLAGGKGDDRLYLLVFQGDSSSMHRLPRDGDVVVGRGDDADLRLDERSVSRKHAKLRVAAGQVQVEDLGSQNGTFVNGEKIAGVRALASGDVINIHSTVLVLHSSEPGRRRAVLEMDAFRDLVESEVERAVGYGRSFALLAVSAKVTAGDRWSMEHALCGELRRIDRMTWAGVDCALVLLPETEVREAREIADHLLTTVGKHHFGARVGYAMCPRDGADAHTILSGARAALATVKTGEVASAEQAFRVIELGDARAIVADESMTRMYALIERLAASDLPVLVTGETGTGKELAAAAVHWFSPRRGKPFVTLNCAALQDTLVESELFGHEKGAFSGADQTKPGLLETAAGGTVFFDEIASLSPSAQAKLLRALETRKFTRVGDVREREADVRFVAAANQDLRDCVEHGTFREDLYFRLSAAAVWLPPLRDRRIEIPILATAFLNEACARAKRPPMTFTEDALQALSANDWPGNVRQLRNIVGYLAAAAGGDTIDAWQVEERLHVGPGRPANPALQPRDAGGASFRPLKDELRDLEERRIREALEAAGGNQTRAAKLISMPLRTFVQRLKQFDIR